MKYFFLICFSLSVSATQVIQEIDVQGAYLVELNDKPALESVSSRELNPARLQKERQRLTSLQESVIAKLAQRNVLPREKVRHRLSLVFNGFSVRASGPLSVDEILAVDGIKAVYEVADYFLPERDFPASILDRPDPSPDDLLPKLNVPSIWSDQKITGKNIQIAVFDTGVDYQHPDLGGCFGPKCKVIGGYDFVNFDSDPMDDHNHGTYVAGIACGNGKKKGVAPDALIVAYKVMNKFGFGKDDDIIKGVEYALDPNNDGDLKDAPQVMNFSLSGPGLINDPMGRAIEIASGYSVVVGAAGNSGRFAPIGLPAAVPSAIAVAASDGDKAIASFSSIGPTYNYTLKPDITAPGVKEWSTSRGSKYLQASGTSAAAPFIAGVVALLRQEKYSSVVVYQVDAIKSRLFTTAAPIPSTVNGGLLSEYYQRGYGLVDPVKALKNRFPLFWNQKGASQYAVSSATSLGAYSVTEEAIETVVNLMFWNPTASVAKDLELKLQHDLGDGAEVSVFPSQKKMAPSQVTYPKVRIRQKISKMGANLKFPYERGVLLTVRDRLSGETIPVPISLFVLPKYTAHFNCTDRLFNYFRLFQEDIWRTYQLRIPYEKCSSPTLSISMHIPPGPYTELFWGTRQFSSTPSIHAYAQSRQIIDKEVSKVFDASALPSQKKFEIYDENNELLPDASFNLELMSPSFLNPSGGGTGFGLIFRNLDKSYTVGTNRISEEWGRGVSTTTIRNSKILLTLDELKFNPEKEVENVKLPANGYQEVRYEFDWDTKPQWLCHTLFGSSRYMLYPGPNLADRVFVGKTAIIPPGGLSSAFITQPVPSSETNACGTGFSLRVAFSDAGPAVGDAAGKPVFSLPVSFPPLSGVPIALSPANLSKSKLSLWAAPYSLKFGTSGRLASHYRLENISQGKIVGEGTAPSDLFWSAGFSLEPNKEYRYTQWYPATASEKDAESLAETFFIARENLETSKRLLGFKKTAWNKNKEGKIEFYFQATEPVTAIARVRVVGNETWENIAVQNPMGSDSEFLFAFEPQPNKRYDLELELGSKRGDRHKALARGIF